MSEELTLFAGDILANHLAQPGTEKARKMTAISGQKLIGSWTKSGPLGSLEKMLLGTSAWASTLCFLTWKSKNSPQGRLLFQLAPLMHVTDETGYGLLPTMTVSSQAQTKENPTPNQTGGTTLAGFARMFPTPTANEDAAGTPNGEMQKMLGNHPEIRGTTPEEWASGALNPTWVEWLMGFPEGWTDLKD